jgi:hypothetical protein
MTHARFTLDAWAFDAMTFDAVRFDRPWNGWVAPVVTFDTLSDLMAAWNAATVADGLGESVTFDGRRSVHVTDDAGETVGLYPDSDGLWHLRDLGWTFVATETETD